VLGFRFLEIASEAQKPVLVLHLNRAGKVDLEWGRKWPLGKKAASRDKALVHRLVLKGAKFGENVLVSARAGSDKWGRAVLKARWITLEVRISNDHAIRLYEAFGFRIIGRRRGYYTDNSEDAVVMWSDSIHAPAFKRTLQRMIDTIDDDVAGIGGPPPDEYPEG